MPSPGPLRGSALRTRLGGFAAFAGRGSLPAKFLRYLVFGGTAAAMDLGLFLLFLELGMALGPAAGLAFAVAVTANYLLCSRFVYTRPLAGWRFVLFVLVALAGLVINAGVTVTTALGFGAPPALAKVTGIGIAFVFNFTVNTAFVFERPAPAER